MVSPGLPMVAIHALLDNGPLTIARDEEAVQVEIKAVLHRRTVHLGDLSTGAYQWDWIPSGTIAQRCQFLGSPTRVASATAADIDAKFVLQRPEAALQGADHASCDACRMPVH